MKYLCDPEVIPTVVPQDISQISSFGTAAAEYSSWIHVDIDDGNFARTLTWPLQNTSEMDQLDAFKTLSALPEALSLEAHLMVADPLIVGERFARAGFKRILVHIEAFATPQAVHEALTAFRAAGAAEVGLALKIDTPLSAIDEFAGECDVIQLMSIAVIGSQGQAFEDRVLARVEELHANHPDMMVSVDGGVSEATVEELVRAGANRLIVGHALSASTSPATTYAKILERAVRGCMPPAPESAI
jgi:ribulose-phosphate 3-epimerase